LLDIFGVEPNQDEEDLPVNNFGSILSCNGWDKQYNYHEESGKNGRQARMGGHEILVLIDSGNTS
jgi:hypothetical protein